MEYLEAVKSVQAHKVKENYLVIALSYSHKIVLPHKEGIAFLTSLSNAEQLKEDYNEPHRITSLDRTALTSTLMSRDEYEQYKIAALLNVSIDEVKAFALQAS